ncbi:MAG: 3-hydroxyacyl-CoA dehydrogenase, partial [Azorhizobium sp. 39-67-5]
MSPVRSDITEAGVAILTIANPPVNALGAAVRGGLLEQLTQAQANPAVTAIVIAAEGKVFVAGADISEFGKPITPPSLPDVLTAIERSPKPVVAAINGMALGGGLELALACHARIVAPGAKLGLPEIKLGIIPGAGGTQRLPRLIGAAPAFAMMASGEPVTADKALANGLADEVVDGDLLVAASAHALRLAEAGAWRLSGAAEGKVDEADRAAFEIAAADAIKKAPRMPNVKALALSVRTGLDKGFTEGLATERAAFLDLVKDPTSKALRHLFFAEREAARVPGIGKEVKARPVGKAAVIGAGTMGGGIAMCFAQAGIPVTLIEVKEQALNAGLARIRSNYETSVKRGSLSQAAMDRHLGFVTGAVGMEAAADADIIVEAAFEDMGVKAEIFGALDRIAKPGAILATNTSYLDVNAIADTTSRPQDVVGLHFFSPANVMRLLEIVRGAKTAPDVLVTSLDLARKIGKLPVVVGVCY